jgi:LuxR family maltose regulon positive regulatory protein
MQYRVLARILVAQGRWDEAVRLLERLLETADAGGQTSRAIEILMLRALAFQSGGDATRAMASLERALTLAEPGGFVRTFVDEGPAMAQLLYEAAAGGIMPDYAGRLLAAFGDTTKDQAQTAGPAPSSSVTRRSSPALSGAEGLIEPLSARELEVLQLIAAGLTNREIAARFFLSLNTVKAHTRNIYGKLSVHSRTQAVAMARAIGLLPSN